ncbi:COR domain-containing protein [Microcoleus sp. S28C3]|uniref:COR domain-containing protein n=1 Tax=Microcoleus sp. S28C3 TaxID=3055414 RepID=UPI002FCFDB07
MGEPGVGKTLLLVSLFGWRLNPPFKITHPERNIEITLHPWDLGGQGVYKHLTKILFCPQAVYLVVWASGPGTKQGLVREWIDLIKHLAPKSKVIVVETHSSFRNEPSDISFQQDIYQEFGHDIVLGFIRVDNKHDSETNQPVGINELQNTIARAAIELPEIGRTIPNKWQHAIEALQTIGKEYLPYTDTLNLCIEAGLEIEQAKFFIRTFHEIGYFIHYQDEPVLKDIVILQPDWLVKMSTNYLEQTFEQGSEFILPFLQANTEAQVTLNEAKLILIGEGEVGKSCLLGALRGDEWIEGRPTTHGIEIKPVIITDPDSGTEISLNGWDFGGQPVYRPTHQLFFSAPAVYLVVWKPREGPQQGFIKEWITLIKHREPDAKVLVVATHGGPGQRQPDIDRQEIQDRFGSDTVLDFFHIDSNWSLD